MFIFERNQSLYSHHCWYIRWFYNYCHLFCLLKTSIALVLIKTHATCNLSRKLKGSTLKITIESWLYMGVKTLYEIKKRVYFWGYRSFCIHMKCWLYIEYSDLQNVSTSPPQLLHGFSETCEEYKTQYIVLHK